MTRCRRELASCSTRRVLVTVPTAVLIASRTFHVHYHTAALAELRCQCRRRCHGFVVVVMMMVTMMISVHLPCTTFKKAIRGIEMVLQMVEFNTDATINPNYLSKP
jgi:hypothetical protein